MGIWFSHEGKDLLVEPLQLAFSLSGWHPVGRFFINQAGGPDIQVSSTEADPVLGDYIWGFDSKDTLYPYVHWDQSNYLRKVTEAIGSLYRHVVIEGKDSAYELRKEYLLTAFETMLESVRDFRRIP